MSDHIISTRRFQFWAALTVVATLTLPALSLSAAHAEDPTTTGNITVDVADDNADPAPITPSPSNPDSPAIESDSQFLPTDSGDVDQQTPIDPIAADEALGEDAVDIKGLLYVSSTTTRTSHGFDPLGGLVTIKLAVRNLSTETITGTVDFWITTAWGWRVSEVPQAEVADLKPGETRELTAHLRGPGQWALFNTHATFTPPETVDGEDTGPLTREAFLFIPPYFALAVLAVFGLIYAVYRVRSRRESVAEEIATA